MAQRDFTGAYKNQPLTAKERTTKKAQLEAEKINLQTLKDLNLKEGRLLSGTRRVNFLKKYNNSIARIKNLEDELKIAPEKRMGATDKNIATGLSLSGSRPRPNIPSSRTATETSSQKNTNSEVKGKPPARGTPTTTTSTSRAYDPSNMVTPQTGKNDSERRKFERLTQKEKEAYRLRRAEAEKKAGTRRDEITFPYKDMPKRIPSLDETLRNNPKFKKVMDNQIIQRFNYPEAGDDSFEDEPQKIDENVNALEKLVSRIVGRNIRFEDIPEDDPFITDMPQNYQNLRRGGQVKRMGHGGAITPEQKKRISRIVQENKARKSKSTKATTPTATTSKKRAAPFSDMKKARMNGNKKRTNR